MIRHVLRVPALLGFFLATAAAQPVVNGIVNAASYRTPGMPASGIAQGSIFAIFGTGLGPANGALAPAQFPLPTDVAGTSVKVTVGGVTKDAIVLYSYGVQVGGILPSTVPVGAGTITVTYNGQPSAPAPINVVASAFGIFAYNQRGFGQAIATDTAYNVNTIIHAFHPGDAVILWGTGLGPISSSDADLPPVGNLASPLQVYVGNSTASVIYHGRSGCCAGLDQIAFTIPAGIEGCHVPVAVRAGSEVGNVMTIAVTASGDTCKDSILGQDLVQKLAAGQNASFGFVQMIEGIGDTVNATFSEYTPSNAGLAEYGVSTGYCTAAERNLEDMSAGQLNAGPAVTVDFAGTPATAPNLGGGVYFLGLTNKFFWNDRQYTISGTGGSRVGAFSFPVRLSSTPVSFANVTRYQQTSRSADLNVKWTDADPARGPVIVGGASISTDSTLYGAFLCAAPTSATEFTIPSWILSTLPASGRLPQDLSPSGYIWVYQNITSPFTAPGIDRGLFSNAFYFLRQVNYQ